MFSQNKIQIVLCRRLEKGTEQNITIKDYGQVYLFIMKGRLSHVCMAVVCNEKHSSNTSPDDCKVSYTFARELYDPL
jgi:hypothetical protein